MERKCLHCFVELMICISLLQDADANSFCRAILKDTAAETEDVERQTNVLPHQFELYCAHRVKCIRNASYLEVTWRHPSQAFSTSDYVISVREHNSSGSILFPRNSVFPPTARNVTVLVALDVGLTYDLHITRRTNQPRWDYTTVTVCQTQVEADNGDNGDTNVSMSSDGSTVVIKECDVILYLYLAIGLGCVTLILAMSLLVLALKLKKSNKANRLKDRYATANLPYIRRYDNMTTQDDNLRRPLDENTTNVNQAYNRPYINVASPAGLHVDGTVSHSTSHVSILTTHSYDEIRDKHMPPNTQCV